MDPHANALVDEVVGLVVEPGHFLEVADLRKDYDRGGVLLVDHQDEVGTLHLDPVVAVAGAGDLHTVLASEGAVAPAGYEGMVHLPRAAWGDRHKDPVAVDLLLPAVVAVAADRDHIYQEDVAEDSLAAVVDNQEGLGCWFVVLSYVFRIRNMSAAVHLGYHFLQKHCQLQIVLGPKSLQQQKISNAQSRKKAHLTVFTYLCSVR